MNNDPNESTPPAPLPREESELIQSLERNVQQAVELTEQLIGEPLPNRNAISGGDMARIIEEMSRSIASQPIPMSAIDMARAPKKCEITQVLPASVLQLVKAAPTNETVRSVLLAHLRVEVPTEHKTYESIKEWIENNVCLPKSPTPSTAAPRARPQTALEVTVTDTEFGNCRYCLNRSGRGDIPMDNALLLEAAQECDSMTEFIRRIEDELYENYSDNIYMEQDGNESTEGHSVTDSDNKEVNLTDSGKEVLKNLVRSLDTDTYQRLLDGENQEESEE